MNVDVYTVGNGALLYEMFNVLAQIRNGNSFSFLIGMSIFAGQVWLHVKHSVAPDPRAMARWWLTAVLLATLVWKPPVTVRIKDEVITGGVVHVSVSVANVPVGAAIIFGVATQFGSALTKLFDIALQIDDGKDSLKSYRQTGFIMGSSLISSSSAITISNPVLQKNFDKFVDECVIYDTMYGHSYDVEDLIFAEDTWDKIKTGTSETKYVSFQETSSAASREVLTCRAAAGKIDAMLIAETKNKSDVYPEWFKSIASFFGSGPANMQALATRAVRDQIKPAYALFAKVSMDSSNILKQHLVRSAISSSAMANSNAAGDMTAISYAVARANEQQRKTYMIFFQQASEWLPLMKNTFEAILLVGFAVVFLAALLPGMHKLLLTYVGSLLVIQIWGFMFSIINYIVVFCGQKAANSSIAFADHAGAVHHSWNMFTSPGLEAAMANQSAFAGFLAISIPVITMTLFKGPGSWGQLSAMFGSATQHSAQQVGEEITSGNLTVGSHNIDVGSMANTSAHHHNSALSHQSQRSDFDTDSGSMMGIMDGGRVTMNQSSGLSQTMTGVSYQEVVSSAINKQYQDSVSNLSKAGVNYTESLSNVSAKGFEYLNSLSQGGYSNDNYGVGDSSTMGNQVQDRMEMIDAFRKNNNLTTDQSFQIMGKAYAGLNTPKALEAVSPWTAGTSGEISGVSSARTAQLVEQAKDLLTSSNATETMDSLLRANKDITAGDTSDYRNGFSETNRASLDELNSLQDTYGAELTKHESASRMNSENDVISHNVQVKGDQGLFEYASNKYGSAQAEALLYDPKSALQIVSEYADDTVNNIKNRYNEGSKTFSDIDKDYGIKQDNISENKMNIPSSFDNLSETIISKAHDSGLNESQIVEDINTKKNSANEFMVNVNNLTASGGSDLKSKGDMRMKHVNHEMSDVSGFKAGLIQKATSNMFVKSNNMDELLRKLEKK